MSMTSRQRVEAALRRAEFVVLQDAFSGTATSAFADLLLPATTWGEKSGTVTNSERRITRVRAALPPHGEARADWAIAAGFGRRLERGLAALGMERRRDPATGSLFDWPDVEAVWNEHRELTRGRDLDITGLSYALLERRGPQQWPMPAGARRGVARLYTDRRFATGDGRAHFHVVGRGGPAERTDEAFPVALLTGRLRDQWHGMSRTGLVGQLFGHEPEPVVEPEPRPDPAPAPAQDSEPEPEPEATPEPEPTRPAKPAPTASASPTTVPAASEPPAAPAPATAPPAADELAATGTLFDPVSLLVPLGLAIALIGVGGWSLARTHQRDRADTSW